jgi:hypothetical protein
MAVMAAACHRAAYHFLVSQKSNIINKPDST